MKKILILTALTLAVAGNATMADAHLYKTGDVRKCKYWGTGDDGRATQFPGWQYYDNSVGWGPCRGTLVTNPTGDKPKIR